MLCAKTFNVGVVKYYADFSDIMDDTVYQCGDRYYVFAREVGYHPSLSQFALIMIPISYAGIHLNRIEVPPRYALIEISEDCAKYISGADSAAKRQPDYGFIAGGSPFTGAVNLSEAKKLPVRNRPTPPVAVEMDGCYDIMENTEFLREEKDPSSWWLMPLVPVALAVDVPVSAAATVVFDGVALPGIALFKAMTTLAGE